jgi:hypothetical protein
MRVGDVVIYSGNEWTFIADAGETIAIQNEYGEMKIVPKAEAIEKYGDAPKSTFGLAILAAIVLGIMSI